jgi:hypothetical protein
MGDDPPTRHGEFVGLDARDRRTREYQPNVVG